MGKRAVLAAAMLVCGSVPAIIANKLKILLQMSLVLVHGLQLPVIRVGRIAGHCPGACRHPACCDNAPETSCKRGTVTRDPTQSYSCRFLLMQDIIGPDAKDGLGGRNYDRDISRQLPLRRGAFFF